MFVGSHTGSDMPEARITEYLAKAEECRREATRTENYDEKAAWLRMAEDWLKLSRAVGRDAAEQDRRNTRVDGETHPVHSQIVSR
jgi:hypothetical protein